MRLLLIAACAALVAGCETITPERCQVADWVQVGEGDGFMGRFQGDRYQEICGARYNPAAYNEGLQKGASRRRPAPV